MLFVNCAGPLSIVVVGAVLSSLTNWVVTSARFVALSAHVPTDATVLPAVSVLHTVSCTVSVLMPDWTTPVSPQSNPIVMSDRCQPAAFGAGVTLPTLMTGFVVSIRTVLVTGVDAWPAMSVQPADVKFVPAVAESTTPPPVAGWSTPEPGSASWQSKCSDVDVLFQPSSVGAGSYTGFGTGGRVSSLKIVNALVPPFPTRSLALQAKSCTPSTVIVAVSPAAGDRHSWPPRRQ